MNEELRYHWSLRAVDDEAARLGAELAKLPELRRALDARVSASRRAVTSLETKASAATKRRREQERVIAAFDADERRFEAQLMTLSVAKQIEAVQHEIAAVRAKRSDVETTALECLEIEERCAAERPALEHALAKLLTEAGTATAGWDGAESAARERLAQLDGERQRLGALLEPAARSRYERLRGGREGRAIAALENGACGACFRAQPPHAAQEARRRDRLITCDGCGRLLLLPPADHA